MWASFLNEWGANEIYAKVKLWQFMRPNFDQGFDFFLLDEIGYPTLKGHIEGLFTSCYSVTSLSEYYAVNFTDYLIYDRKKVKDICPAAFHKITNLITKRKLQWVLHRQH